MGLFGGDKTEVTMELAAQEVVGGQPLVVKVRVGSPDKKAQGGRVELYYRNTFQRDEVDNHSSSSSIGGRTRHKRNHTEEVEVVSRPLASGGKVTEGESTVELPVPLDAPASSAGTVDWQVRAVVDRKMAMDATAEDEVTVVTPAGALSAWAGTGVESSGKAEFAIEVAKREVRPGEQLTGTATVTASEDATARAIRVQLHMVRFDKDGHTKEETASETVLAEDVELQSGRPWQGSFSVTVPQHAAPSFKARHNSQHWYLEVVVDRKRAGDYEGKLELVVHAG